MRAARQAFKFEHLAHGQFRDRCTVEQHKWLAEAAGWRESMAYDGWDVKQFVTNQNLCDIGNGWQRCEAKGSFGQFRPVGFDLHAREGTPSA